MTISEGQIKQHEERAARRRAATRAWCRSADGATFIAALEKEGYRLARGTDQSYLLVDGAGRTHSITRLIEGVKPKDIKRRLAGVPATQLMDVQTTRDKARPRQSDEQPTSCLTSEHKSLSRASCLLLVSAVLLAYSNVYHNQFIYDDISLIRDNVFLTSWRHIGTLFITPALQGAGASDSLYRPLQMLIYLLFYQTFGSSTVAFHLLNVTLHALNGCLLYALGVRLGFERVATFLAALIWEVHPIQVEAVTYMSSTSGLLCSTFVLAGILTLARDFSNGRILLACLLFGLGLLSKETAVVFPLLVMGLIFYRSENKWSLRTYLRTWPLWLIASLYILARGTFLNFNGFYSAYTPSMTADVTIVDRSYMFLATLPSYFRLLVWPTCLHMERTFPVYMTFWTPQVIAGFVLLAAACCAIAWRPLDRATPLAWGALWAGMAHSPVSGVLFWTNSVFAERWLYLPTMGLALGLAESLVRISAPTHAKTLRYVFVGLSMLVACVFGRMTFEQNKFWRDPFVFYAHIFQCGDESSAAHNNLGVAYQDIGRYELAVVEYRRALELSDENVEAHYNLARALLQLDYGPATILQQVEHLRSTLAVHPGYYRECVRHLQRAIEVYPDYYKAYDMLAVLYSYSENYPAALEAHAKSVEIRKRLGI